MGVKRSERSTHQSRNTHTRTQLQDQDIKTAITAPPAGLVGKAPRSVSAAATSSCCDNTHPQCVCVCVVSLSQTTILNHMTLSPPLTSHRPVLMATPSHFPMTPACCPRDTWWRDTEVGAKRFDTGFQMERCSRDQIRSEPWTLRSRKPAGLCWAAPRRHRPKKYFRQFSEEEKKVWSIHLELTQSLRTRFCI